MAVRLFWISGTSCEGYVGWRSYQIEASDYIIIVCSEGWKAELELRPRDPQLMGQGVSFIVAVSMIAQKLCQVVLHSGDLSKFIVAFFTQSGQGDIPATLDLASKYHLMKDFPSLFAHLHSIQLCRPGYTLHVDRISADTYWHTPTGLALYNTLADLYDDNSCQTSGFIASDTGREDN